jgi:hypothetical protein
MADFSKPMMALFDNLIAAYFKKGEDIMFIMVSSSCFQVATQADGGLGCDSFREYTDTQIRIGRCASVFPLHTVSIFLSAYLFCKIVFLVYRYTDTHTK